MTTTFAQQTGLEVRLPEAGSKTPPASDKPLDILIDSEGHYLISGHPVPGANSEALKSALKAAAGDQKDPLILIEADRDSRHQALVMTLDALAQLGFERISFATITAPSH